MHAAQAHYLNSTLSLRSGGRLVASSGSGALLARGRAFRRCTGRGDGKSPVPATSTGLPLPKRESGGALSRQHKNAPGEMKNAFIGPKGRARRRSLRRALFPGEGRDRGVRGPSRAAINPIPGTVLTPRKRRAQRPPRGLTGVGSGKTLRSSLQALYGP